MRKHETAVCGTARTVVWEVGKCENRRQMPFMTSIYLLPDSGGKFMGYKPLAFKKPEASGCFMPVKSVNISI